MKRLFKTWIIVAASLAAVAQPVFAKGPSPRSGSFRSGISRAAISPRQSFKPAQSVGGVGQTLTSRVNTSLNGSPGNTVQTAVTRSNNANLNLVTRNRTQVDLHTPSLTPRSTTLPRNGIGNSQLSNSPVTRVRDGVGTISRIELRRNNGSSDQLPNNSFGNPIIPPGFNNPVVPPTPTLIPDSIRPVRGNDGLGDHPVFPVDPAAGLRDHQPIDLPDPVDGIPPRDNAPPANGEPNPSPDEPPANGGTDTPPVDTPPVDTPPVDTPPADTPVDVPVDTPVEEPPVPADGSKVCDTGTSITNFLSQIVGSVGVAPSAPVGFPATAEVVESTPEAVAEPADAATMDLQITDVRLVEAGDLDQDLGPRYRIVCRNNGSVELPKFHVSVLVDLGKKITEKAEVVTVESVGILPGNTHTVDVRLPVSVLKMIPERSKAKPFETFAAFVDADERLSETDEENNILLLSRDAIKPLQSAETGKATSNQADAKTPEGTK